MEAKCWCPGYLGPHGVAVEVRSPKFFNPEVGVGVKSPTKNKDSASLLQTVRNARYDDLMI